jgi:hypothetical protein
MWQDLANTINYNAEFGNFEQTAIRVHLSSDQTISHDSEETLEFATEDFDRNSEWDTSTYKFTPNEDGYYCVMLQVSTEEADTIRLYPRVYIQTTMVTQVAHINSQSKTTINTYDLFYLQTDESVQFKCYAYNETDSGDVVIEGTDGEETFATIHRVG